MYLPNINCLFSILILLDLPSVFETVDHSYLLEKVSSLMSCFNILTWFVYSLRGQSFSTRISHVWVVPNYLLLQKMVINNLGYIILHIQDYISRIYSQNQRRCVILILTVMLNCSPLGPYHVVFPQPCLRVTFSQFSTMC